MATRLEKRWRSDRRNKFSILHRDGFSCRYCGARPGSEFLEVDHLVPRARRGTDRAENFVTACKTCNGRKSDSIMFPHDLIERQDDDVWFVHKTFGEWRIVFCHESIGIDNDFGYGFLDSHRWPDKYWWGCLHEKQWSKKRLDDLLRASVHLGQLVHLPRD